MTNSSETHGSTLFPPVSERDHSCGHTSSVVTLVEYGDYHDPRCASAQPWIEALQARMGDRLRLVFRHFPQALLHPHAAEAAEAAGLQGRFWSMHASLMQHHEELGNGFLVEYARDIGLDTNRFLRDMTGHVCVERVRADRADGARSGVRNTPTFFLNGDLQPQGAKSKGSNSSFADVAPAWADSMTNRFPRE